MKSNTAVISSLDIFSPFILSFSEHRFRYIFPYTGERRQGRGKRTIAFTKLTFTDLLFFFLSCLSPVQKARERNDEGIRNIWAGLERRKGRQQSKAKQNIRTFV